MAEETWKTREHQRIQLSMSKGKWDKVEEAYGKMGKPHAPINEKGDTVLHLAISDAKCETVRSLLKKVTSNVALKEVLKARNKNGDSPLHIAASIDKEYCECIIEESRRIDCPGEVAQELITASNKDGETPIFVAVQYGHDSVYKYLIQIAKDAPDIYWYRKQDGSTILHAAISGEYFDLALSIIRLFEEDPKISYNLASSCDVKGQTPLHILATKPSAFRSGTPPLGGLDKIIYDFMWDGQSWEFDEGISLQPNYIKNCLKFILQPIRNAVNGCLIWFRNLSDTIHISCLQGVRSMCFQTGAYHGDDYLSNMENNLSSGIQTLESKRIDPAKFPPNYATICFFCELLLKIPKLLVDYVNGIERKASSHILTHRLMLKLIEHYDIEEPGTEPLDEIYPSDMLPPELFSGVLAESEPLDESHPGETLRTESLPGAAPQVQGDQQNTSSKSAGENSLETKSEEVEQVIILRTARMGLAEMVNKILEKVPNVIYDRRDDGMKNALLIAVETRGKEDKKQEASAKIEEPILIAARTGLTEMVKEILRKYPDAINKRRSEDGKNAVLVAVENRRVHLWDYFNDEYKNQSNKRWETVIRQVDKDENNCLHLAAAYSEQKPWLMPGEIMKMHWDIKWHEYVRDSIPPHLQQTRNKKGKTPKEVFTESHKPLLEGDIGGKWLESTYQSCTLVASLIATVAFASATTVPGGNGKRGNSDFQRHPAFSIFVIAAFIALCFSVTSLIMFLTLLVTGHRQSDFSRGLPRNLTVSLYTLFISIAAMLVSFCAGHFFFFIHAKRYMIYVSSPIYILGFLSVIAIVFVQFPFYHKLLLSVYSKKPRPCYEEDIFRR